MIKVHKSTKHWSSNHARTSNTDATSSTIIPYIPLRQPPHPHPLSLPPWRKSRYPFYLLTARHVINSSPLISRLMTLVVCSRNIQPNRCHYKMKSPKNVLWDIKRNSNMTIKTLSPILDQMLGHVQNIKNDTEYSQKHLHDKIREIHPHTPYMPQTNKSNHPKTISLLSYPPTSWLSSPALPHNLACTSTPYRMAICYQILS